jgi:hypothetical protein
MTQRTQTFIIGSGLVFLLLGFFRIYLFAREFRTDLHPAPHLLVTFLSLVIAGAILRVGLLGDRFTRRSAQTLIRSGSILLMIWGYRTYLILRTLRSPIELKAHLYLAAFYVVLGTLVMLVGFRLSRKLRHAPLPQPSVSS